MLTADQILDYLERVIAEDKLSGNRVGLKHSQVAANLLSAVARQVQDAESARKFQLLAAEAAGRRDELEGR